MSNQLGMSGTSAKVRSGANRPVPTSWLLIRALKRSNRTPMLSVIRSIVHESWTNMPRLPVRYSFARTGVL